MSKGDRRDGLNLDVVDRRIAEVAAFVITCKRRSTQCWISHTFALRRSTVMC